MKTDEEQGNDLPIRATPEQMRVFLRRIIKSTLILIPVFVLPAIGAVIIIKKTLLKGVFQLIPIFGALAISWVIVIVLLRFQKK